MFTSPGDNSAHRTIYIDDPGTLFFAGDIHGHIHLLKEAMDKAGFKPESGHKIILCGDVVDGHRGSTQAVAFLHHEYVDSVLGNHDVMMLNEAPKCDEKTYRIIADYFSHDNAVWQLKEYIRGNYRFVMEKDFVPLPQIIEQDRDFLRWVANDGDWYFRCGYGEAKLALRKLQEANLPNTIEIKTPEGNIGVVHAAVPRLDWQALRSKRDVAVNDDSLWARRRLVAYQEGKISFDDFRDIEGLNALVLGHSNVKPGEICVINNSWYLDTNTKSGNMPCVIRASDILAGKKPG